MSRLSWNRWKKRPATRRTRSASATCRPINTCRTGLRALRRAAARSASCGSRPATNHAGAIPAAIVASRPAAGSEDQADRVDLGLEANRKRAGELADAQNAHAPGRQHHPGDDAGRREQQHLGQRRGAEADAGRAERETNPELALADAGARQQQVGDVAADGDEDEQHQELQQPQGGAQHALRPARGIHERRDLGAERLVGSRIGRGQLAHRRVEVGLGGGARHVRAQAAHQRVAALRAVVELARALHHHRRHRRRQPHVERQAERRALKAARRDADDGERHVVDPDRFADRRGRAAKARLPVAVRDDGDRTPARRRGVVGLQQPAGGRREGERGEVVAGHEEAGGAADVRNCTDRERHHAERQQPLERREAGLQVAMVEPGGSDVDPVRGARLDRLKRRCRGDAGQRLPPHSLQPGEHDSVGADADRERRDDDRRHERHRAQRAQGVADLRQRQTVTSRESRGAASTSSGRQRCADPPSPAAPPPRLSERLASFSTCSAPCQALQPTAARLNAG